MRFSVQLLLVVLCPCFLGWAEQSKLGESNEFPPDVFFKIGTANDYRGKTHLLVGKVQKNGIEIMYPNGKNQFFPFELTVEAESTQSPSTEGILPSSEAAITTQLTDPTANLDLKRPSVQFEFTHNETKKCTRLKEFQTFLSQLEVLKSVIPQFEISASGPQYEACAHRVAKLIVKAGIPANIFIGSLPKGGVHIRGYLGASSSASQEIDNPKKKSGKYKPSGLWVVLPDKSRSLIFVNPDGFFVRSFYKTPSEVELFYRGNEHELRFKIKEIPIFQIGENQVEFDQAKTAQIYSNRWDRIERIELPNTIVQQALEKAKAAEKNYRLTLGLAPKISRLSGSGINGTQTTIIPITLFSKFRITQDFILNLDVSAPVILNSKVPKILFVGGDLNYWIFGKEPLFGEKKPSRFHLGVMAGSFYHRARASGESTPESSSGVLLTDMIGAYGGLRLQERISKPITLLQEAKFAPLPSTAVNDFSLSYIGRLGMSYQFNFRHCLYFFATLEKYAINLLNQDKLDAEVTSMSIGYRFTFK